MTAYSTKLPLFPLHTVLFPEGPLPLRIFEPRYTDMICRCLKNEEDFGICLIKEGNETGQAATTHNMGTIAKISDWHTRHDGLLSITVTGKQRFTIQNTSVTKDQLSLANIELCSLDVVVKLTEEFQVLASLLEKIIENLGHHYANIGTRYDDACWVSYRLAELLPLTLIQKQNLLMMNDSIMRLERLVSLMKDISYI